jgi:hypothetical protein
MKGKLLLIMFIGLPIIGELIQLNFPGSWNFCFEYQDIMFNYVGAISGGLLCSFVRGVGLKHYL